MRFHSTPESALKGEITKLAIIETIAAVGLYAWVGLHFGTFKYFALAVVSAPIMLFRTAASARVGIRLYKRYGRRMTGLILGRRGQARELYAGAYICSLPVVGMFIRIATTFYCAIRHPWRTLLDTPENWLRQSLCVDFLHPP